MKLTIDDGRELQQHAIPACVRDAIAILTKLPDGKLLTLRGLAQRAQKSYDRLAHYSADPALAPFKFKPQSTTVYFGNPNTIKAAVAQFKS